jgi:hypothetical protein
MTEDLMLPISCDDIEERLNDEKPFFVYFGSYESIAKGDMMHLLKVSAHDRFTFEDQLVQFFFNPEPECAERR